MPRRLSTELGRRHGARSRASAPTRCGGWPKRSFDVVVIGGGATGAGCALDAATRGLSVALVEARDFAAGTSSRSSKLIHGGLRYLEQSEFGLVREALRERSLLLNVPRAPPRPAGALPVPADPPRVGARLRRRRDAALRRARRPQGHAPPPPPDQAPGAARSRRRCDPDALIGALQYDDARSTTPATRSPWSARRRASAPPWPTPPRWSASCARAAG